MISLLVAIGAVLVSWTVFSIWYCITHLGDKAYVHKSKLETVIDNILCFPALVFVFIIFTPIHLVRGLFNRKNNNDKP